jgi:hypothetical protein
MIMEIKKKFTCFVVAFALLSIGSLSWAAEDVFKVSLMATKHHPEAKGIAVISDENIFLKAKGLKPDSVYTVWFVNMNPQKHEAGAGEAPYMFKTDSSGGAVYSSPLGGSPKGKWEMLMVVLHPTGDSTDMENMVGGLSAKL